MGGRGNIANRNVKPTLVVNAKLSGRWDVTLNNVDDYTIWRSGGIVSSYGEIAHLIEAQDKYLVFKTESGTKFKTDYSLNTIGKAKKYALSLKDITGDKYFKKTTVDFKGW